MRILLADDDADVREAMRDFLLCEGFQILEADSGLAALEILLKEHGRMTFSIMDVDMPGMTGFEVLRQVRSRNLSLPCIFITGDDSRQRQVEALEVGAFSLLTKPVALDVLRFSMRRLLDRHFRGCR
ncbi:MAG: response regulator [Planctomycetes bacterium]|nr:response regulator [Planctomycetota bacterium]